MEECRYTLIFGHLEISTHAKTMFAFLLRKENITAIIISFVVQLCI